MSDQQEEPFEHLRDAIRANHGMSAKHIFATYVREGPRSETVWRGIVDVFEIEHPAAERCYAWKYETDDGRYLVATVLGIRPIKTAKEAVRSYYHSEDNAGRTMN